MKVAVAPLRLERWIPLKDVRQLIWRYLRPIELEMIKCAHNAAYVNRINFEADWYLFADGFLNVIRWLVRHANYREVHPHIWSALARGHTKIFYWALQKQLITPTQEHLRAFIAVGRLDMLEWFHKHHTRCG